MLVRLRVILGLAWVRRSILVVGLLVHRWVTAETLLLLARRLGLLGVIRGKVVPWSHSGAVGFTIGS